MVKGRKLKGGVVTRLSSHRDVVIQHKPSLNNNKYVSPINRGGKRSRRRGGGPGGLSLAGPNQCHGEGCPTGGKRYKKKSW